MMYIEPTSQYKFVAKPVAPAENDLVKSDASGDVGTAVVPVAVSTANLLPQTNTATHFQAAEHVQNKILNRQGSVNAAAPPGGQGPAGQGLTYDGKRMRKAVQRRTVDYNSSVIRFLESRKWFKSSRNQHAIQPHEIYNIDVVPPGGYIKNPMNAVTTKFVRTSTNKLRCPIFCVVWTPEGRRLVTGASSGEFTLWNGLTFNFETILQAHDRAVRSMVWSHHNVWLLTGDHGGFVKYWQSNMNNVKMYEAHKEPIRGLSFSPSDSKFASCSDDGLVKVWDFYRCVEERQLKGHGADVKCVDWHPSKGLLVSGSKDSQQPIKLWDPKSGNSITTLHSHKSTVMAAKWNSNGNWLLTGSRDHLLKVFDIRVMKEFQTFRGHKKEATAVAWHPIHETLFSSGGSDGSIMFWLTGVDEKAGAMDKAHEGIVWSLAWHPIGHILCSGSNDHTSKFWTRNRPGDAMHDRYNLDICQQDDGEYNEDGVSNSMVPGLAALNSNAIIPGVCVPVTASNVVLPESNETDEDVALYGNSARDNFLSSQPTSSSSVPTPSHPVHTGGSRHVIPGQFPSGMPPIPGLGGQNAGMARRSESEGVRDSFNPPRGVLPGPRHARPPRPGFDRNADFPNNQAPVRPRPPFAGNRQQFHPGHRPSVDFFPRGPANRDPGMNFRPPFPPNQFMRFPGPPGPHGGQNFRPRPMSDHPRDLGPRPMGDNPHDLGPRPKSDHPRDLGPRPMGDNPHDLGPRPMSDHPRDLGPRPMGDNPHDLGPRPKSDHPRDLGPRPMGDNPHDLGPRPMSDHPRDLGPRPMGDNPHVLGPRPMSDHPRDLGPRPMGDNPRDLGPRPMSDHPRDLGPRPMDDNTRDLGPRPMSDHPRDLGPRPMGDNTRDLGPRPMSDHPRDLGPRPMGENPRDQPMGDHPRDLGPRPMGDRPRDLEPKPHGFGPPRPEMRLPDQGPMRDRENTEGGKEHCGIEQDRNSEARHTRRGNDSPRVSPPKLPNNRGRPQRRGSDPSAPGILGDYKTHQRELEQRLINVPQVGGEGHLFHGNSFEGKDQTNAAHLGGPTLRAPVPSSDVSGPSFTRQNSNPHSGQPFQPRFERPDGGRPGERGLLGEPPLDRPDMARPRDRPLHDRPDRIRPGERGLLGDPPDLARSEGLLGRPVITHFTDHQHHERPDMVRSGTRPPQERADITHPGTHPSHDRPDMGRSGTRPPHERPDITHPGTHPSHERPDIGRLGTRPPHERADITHPGTHPSHDRSDMGRSGTRTPHERPDIAHPGTHPSHERPDIGRSGTRPPHERPDITRPGTHPSHDRPDMGRSGTRPSHERPDITHPDDQMFRNRPETSHPDDRQMHDRPDGPPREGRPYEGTNHRPSRPGMGPPFPPSRDPQFPPPMNERPRGDFNRSPRDRAPPERPESMPIFDKEPGRAAGPPNPGGEQGKIKPLMNMRPRSAQETPVGEKRSRKRSMEHEFDRGPKRMETGDRRDGDW